MIIGIGGCSQSGKSTLARRIFERVAEKGRTACILSMDNFAYEKDQLPLIRDQIDWEVPASIDFEKYRSVILSVKAEYQILICEGFLIYNQPAIVELFDKKMFLEISKTTYLKRRKKDLRWGIMPDWYLAYVWESYLKFGLADHVEDVLVLNVEEVKVWEEVERFLEKG